MRLVGLVVVLTVIIGRALGICVGCSDAFAATYYTPPSGSDSNPGSLSLPFRTIQRCANIAVGGDTCFIRTGTYRETVRPSQSGSAGAPITFQAYPGDTVTLTGTDPVRGWTVDSGSIYKAPLLGTVNQVFVDGQMMTWARWPNDKGPDNASGGYVIHHNVFWKMANQCVSFPVNSLVDTSNVTYTANDNYLFNNTFYDCGIDVYLYQPSGADTWTQKVYNNIFTDATELRSGADVSNNIYRGTDPRFVNPAAFNFQLQSGSPAIDTGRVIPGITDGHVGSAPDVGAYEFGATPWRPGHSDVTWADPFPFPASTPPSSPSLAPSAPSGTTLWPFE